MGAVNLEDSRNILVHATQGTLSVKDVSSFGAFVNGNKIKKSVHETKGGYQFTSRLRVDISNRIILRWLSVVCFVRTWDSPSQSLKNQLSHLAPGMSL